MDMGIDAANVLKKIRGIEPERGRISLYFDKQLWKEFQKHCEGLAASRVMEELAREFIASSGKKISVTNSLDSIDSSDQEIQDLVSLFKSLDHTQRAGFLFELRTAVDVGAAIHEKKIK